MSAQNKRCKYDLRKVEEMYDEYGVYDSPQQIAENLVDETFCFPRFLRLAKEKGLPVALSTAMFEAASAQFLYHGALEAMWEFDPDSPLWSAPFVWKNALTDEHDETGKAVFLRDHCAPPKRIGRLNFGTFVRRCSPAMKALFEE